MTAFTCFDSPIGKLVIGLEDGAVVSLRLSTIPLPYEPPCPADQTVIGQLQEYFSGSRQTFQISINPRGTLFQQRVWQELMRIPYGQTRAYSEIAAAIGKPGAARAVGQACNRNPIWLLIPCHRVISNNGKLTGYAGGLDIKQKLLELEHSNV